MLRNMVISLFLTDSGKEGEGYGRIVTTREKAKEARRLAEKVVTLGKKGTHAARRRALQLIGSKQAVRKVFETIGPRYANRPGGYTRILGFPRNRLGDNASQVVFELVEPLSGGEAVRPEVAGGAASEKATEGEAGKKA